MGSLMVWSWRGSVVYLMSIGFLFSDSLQVYDRHSCHTGRTKGNAPLVYPLWLERHNICYSSSNFSLWRFSTPITCGEMKYVPFVHLLNGILEKSRWKVTPLHKVYNDYQQEADWIVERSVTVSSFDPVNMPVDAP